MKSFIAALRTLVLPYGSTTGTRIVIDGVAGRISLFDGSNNEVIREDSATQTIAVGDADGTGARIVLDGANAYLRAYDATNAEKIRVDAGASEIVVGSQTTGARVEISDFPFIDAYDASNNLGISIDALNSYIDVLATDGSAVSLNGGGAADIYLNPPDLAGKTWDPADIYAGFYASSPYQPYLNLLSPCESGYNYATIALTGGDSGDTTTEMGFYSNDHLLWNNYPILVSIADNVESSNVSFTTTVTTTDSVSFTAIAGAWYEIEHTATWHEAGAGGWITGELRENNSGGTVRDSGEVWTANGRYPKLVLRALWQASSTGTKTFVVTGVRAYGANTCYRIGSSTNPSILSVKKKG